MTQNRHQRRNDDLASEILENLKNPPTEIVNPRDTKSSTAKYLIIATCVILIVAVGGFIAWNYFKKDAPPENQSVPQTETGQVPSNNQVSQVDQEYKSDRLMIDVKHPANWKVAEEDKTIEISSPETEITDSTGSQLPAEFKILIKLGAEISDSEYLGRGFAVKKSEPLKYNDPTINQLKESLITGFGLDSSDHFAYFVVQGNFKLNKNDSLGADFASRENEVLVSGGYYSDDSADKTKLVPMNPGSYSSEELYKTAVEIIKTLRLR